jgi:putative spermidine/putrescine transport system ATP-binding protein
VGQIQEGMMTASAVATTDPVAPPLAGAGASVELNGICKTYGDVTAVDDVSLHVDAGQFVTLLGASGSGKTTLLRIIAGFLAATSGQVVIDGQDISRVPVHKRKIGMVFQNYALFPHMNVAKNVAFPLAMNKVPRGQRAALVDEALEAVHLAGYGKRMPSELSGGQQQRIAVARAIVSRPRLLLMDEPLGALDRRLRESLQIEMLRLSRELGLTVINVTHDQEEALTMSDRIALLTDGQLAQWGAPQDLYDRPDSEIVARFLGESNLFRAPVRTQPSGAAELDLAHGRVLVQPREGSGLPVSGDTAVVIVRPSHVQLVEPGQIPALDPGHCWVSGKVVATIFAGESRKVIVESAAGEELVARQSGSARVFDPGEEVALTWAAAASVTLAAA